MYSLTFIFSQLHSSDWVLFVNNRSHGTVTSIRNIIVHYGSLVHPENNPGLCDFYYNYSSVLQYMGYHMIK